jgi:hypothetical protein
VAEFDRVADGFARNPAWPAAGAVSLSTTRTTGQRRLEPTAVVARDINK